jgi:UDP-N-acetylmuramoylalanine--D-glutamate ligase
MSLDSQLQTVRCLNLAVTGANGKSTAVALIERLLRHNQRKVAVFDAENPSNAAALRTTSELDYLIVQLNALQVRSLESFRPAVAVLLNTAASHPELFGDADAYARAFAPLFCNQQFFDWAVIQSEALARLRALDVPLPAKIITFSASDSSADLFLDRGLLVSRLANWSGPLLDMDHCVVHGAHNAENLLATLAVGHVLRLPLEGMGDPLKTFQGLPHRSRLIAELNGVQFIDDSKASNLHAMQSAVNAARPGSDGQPNVWLIADGVEQGEDFHAAGPVLSKRVKGVFLIGNVSQKIHSAWSLFTPCMVTTSLLEALAEAARSAASGDVVLLSPACSGLDQFRNYQHRGQVFYEMVKSIGRGAEAHNPYMHGAPTSAGV